MGYDKDTRKYHRFLIECETGLEGTLYIPKSMKPLPKVITLERVIKEVIN